jgi:hypothetical protein
MISEGRFYGAEPDELAVWRSRIAQAGYGRFEHSVWRQIILVSWNSGFCSNSIMDIIHDSVERLAPN